MGGNAFKSGITRRIQRSEILPTLYHVCDMGIPFLSMEYLQNSTMGSLGKQDTSGDIDIALNNQVAKFVGQPNLPVFSLREINQILRKVLGDENVSSKTIKSGQIQTAIPVCGNHSLGRVQVDFISGNVDWLKFTHYSPGLDYSPYKGVFISTMMGVLCKIHPDFVIKNDSGITTHRIGYHYDLEKGLYRRWGILWPNAKLLSSVDPDYFETKVPSAPRMSRIGYIDNPDEMIRIVFGKYIDREHINTFEKLVSTIKELFSEKEFLEIKSRFIAALMRSGAKSQYTIIELENLDVWK